MKRILVVALVMSVSSLAASAPVNAHNERLKCRSEGGAGAGWFKVRAHAGIGCHKARRLAERWENKCVWDQSCPGEPDQIKGIDPGFRCRDRQAGYETVRVRCTANGQQGIVHFLWGS